MNLKQLWTASTSTEGPFTIETIIIHVNINIQRNMFDGVIVYSAKIFQN
jgi:hypothetical protein